MTKTTTTLNFKIDSLSMPVDEIFNMVAAALQLKKHYLARMSLEDCDIVIEVPDRKKPIKEMLPPIIEEISRVFENLGCELYTGTVHFEVSKSDQRIVESKMDRWEIAAKALARAVQKHIEVRPSPDDPNNQGEWELGTCEIFATHILEDRPEEVGSH